MTNESRLLFVALMRAAEELCDDPALALHYGETVDMAEVSIVGLIMNASETMMDAFVQMQRFGRLAVEVETVSAGPRFELVRQNEQLWMVDTRSNPNDFPQLTEAAFARLVCGPRRFLPRPHVLEVHFTHARRRPDRAEHDRVFQCPVRFASHWNAMSAGPHFARTKSGAAATLCVWRLEQTCRSDDRGFGEFKLHKGYG